MKTPILLLNLSIVFLSTIAPAIGLGSVQEKIQNQFYTQPSNLREEHGQRKIETQYQNSSVRVIGIGSSFQEVIRDGRNPLIFDNQILKASASGNTINVTGIKVGESNIKINGKITTVQVVSPRLPEKLGRLEKICDQTFGVSCSLTQGHFTISGAIYRFSDFLKLKNKINEIDSTLIYQLQFKDQNGFYAELEKHINNELQKAGLIPQRILQAPAAEVKINSNNPFKEQYRQHYQKYGIKVSLTSGSLTLKQTLNIKITIAEVRKSAWLKYGMSWPDAFQASLLPNGIFQNGQADFALNTLSNDGSGKILAQPNIICRSGEEAEFLAGGEIPIKIVNYKYQQVQWKKYGIQLNVKPKIDESGRISLSIVTEISTIDATQKAEDIPGFLTNKATSHFDMNHSQTIAISGLIKSEDSQNHSGLPGIKNLPVLGKLFSSQEFRNNQTELIIFVTPTLMDIL